MRKVYIITYMPTGEIHKVFSSRQFADKYLNQQPYALICELSEPEEYKVEQ